MEKSKSSNVRNSSLELLRIICMILIVFHHYVYHGNMLISRIYFNEELMKVLSLGGKFACNVFVLIMGYFMINSEFKGKKILKLITKMFAYGIIIAITYFILERNFDVKLFVKELLPIIYGGWFVVTYIIMSFISPFLNKMLKSLSKKDFQKLLIVIFVIWSVVPTYTINAWRFSDIDSFLVMYMFGAYIRLFDFKIGENIKNLQFGVLFGGIAILLAIVLTIIGKWTNLIILRVYANYSVFINNILTVLSSLFIFLYFKNINFENSKVNWIAQSMLGVYLIHDDNIVRPYLWNVWFPNYVYKNSKFLVVHCFTKVFIVFVVCVIIDKIMEFILNHTIYKYIDKMSIQNKFFVV